MAKILPTMLLPARERAASALRKAILVRELKAGDVLSLEATAARLGESVHCIREAFQILVFDGFIELNPAKGAVVCGVQDTLLHDHYEMRAVLESAACRLICRKHADLTDIIAAHEAARQALQAKNDLEYAVYNQTFHFEIWTACGNEKIRTMAGEMWSGLSVGADSTALEYAAVSLDEHERILQALKNYDAEAAADAMFDHIMRSMNSMMTHFKDEH